MSSEAFVDKMKGIQNSLLEFLEDESDEESKYDNIINLVSSQQIINTKYEFKSLLQLISRIGNNHQRSPNFISKIERLLRHFKPNIQEYFSNSEIFQIFEDNKRILLILIEEKIMIIDEHIFSILTSFPYHEYFYCDYFKPELKPFFTIENIKKYRNKNEILINEKFIERMNEAVDESFYDKRREGENDDYLCQLIRLDKIKEFVQFVSQTNLSLESQIKKSIFETNKLLIDYSFKLKLIDYTLFFGSIKIIQYLIEKTKNVSSELWIYSIHTNDSKMINLLENYQIKPDTQKVLEESIKCHHNEISSYIIDNLIKEEGIRNNIENKYYDNLYRYAVESYNYCFFPTNMKYKNLFFYLCEFDYYTLVKLFLSEFNIDINARIKTLII